MRRVLFSTVVVGQLALIAVVAMSGSSWSLAAPASSGVVAGTGIWTVPSPPMHSSGAEAGEPVTRLAVAGDVGTGDAAEWGTAELMDAAEGSAEFDALVLLGDNAYPHGDPELLRQTVFDPFGAVLDGETALLGVLGNHDVEGNHAVGQMKALGMPGRWYARSFGEVLVVVLDSTAVPSAAQIAFLDKTLASSHATWKIVAMHHPPYSAGSHGSDIAIREAFEPVFVARGVDLVLAGHDHDCQRSKPVDGVTYVVSGAAARVRAVGKAAFTEVSAGELHFVTLDVWSDQLTVTAFTVGGILDRVVLDAS